MKLKIKSLALLITFSMIFTMIPSVSMATSFSDMPSDWSTVALESAVSNGLLSGFDGKLMPKDSLTRAQMATVINRAFGATSKANISNFTDIATSAWYYEDMAKAVQMKTFAGSVNKLNPQDNITREEAFLVLSRAFNLSGAKQNALDKFVDKDLVSPWAKDGVASITLAGYASGSDGKLNPKQNITRAEFALIMDNLIKTYINKIGTYTTVADGNVMVNVPDVILKDLTVKGDLIIGDGVGDGDVTLDNVTVTGRTLIRGGGENSIRIIGNSNIPNIIITRVDGIVRILAEDGTNVGEVIIDGNDDVIVEGSIGSISVIAQDITITAKNANIKNATISGENSKLVVDVNSTIATIFLDSANAKLDVSGQVTNIQTSEKAEGSDISVASSGKVGSVVVNSFGTNISGSGSVNKVEAKADNVKITTPNTLVTAAKGTTGVIAGETAVKPGTTTDSSGKKPESPSGGGSSSGGGDPTPTEISIKSASAINEAVTIGINEEYNLADNLVFSPSDATVTYSSDDVTGVYSKLVAGKLTGIKQGRATITAEVSKTGYVSKTVSFEVLVAPVLLSWTDPSGDRITGEQKTIVVNVSLLEGVKQIDAVAVYMMWEKNVETVWQAVNTADITIIAPHGILTGEDGLYKLNEGFVLTDGASISITSDVTFNEVGKYRVSVYAIKVNLK